MGSSIQPIISFGAPNWTAFSSIILKVSQVHFLALGCGEKTIPFLVFKDMRALKIAVDVGFVVGITPAITPTGQAIFAIPCILSLYTIPQVFVFLYLL